MANPYAAASTTNTVDEDVVDKYLMAHAKATQQRATHDKVVLGIAKRLAGKKHDGSQADVDDSHIASAEAIILTTDNEAKKTSATASELISP